MAPNRYNNKNPSPKKAHWYDEGGRYAIGIADNLLYTNADWTRGKVTVFIRDKIDGKIHQRTGDAQMIGNFSPIFINWKGKKVQVEQLLQVR